MGKVKWEGTVLPFIFSKDLQWEEVAIVGGGSSPAGNARVFNFSNGYTVGVAPPEWTIDGEVLLTWTVQAVGPNATYPNALRLAKTSGSPFKSRCQYTEPAGDYLTSLTQAESIWLVRLKASNNQNFHMGSGTRVAEPQWYGLGVNFGSAVDGVVDACAYGNRIIWDSDWPNRSNADGLASSSPIVYQLDDTTWWLIRHRVQSDDVVKYKVWKYGESEPTEWTKEYTTSNMTVAQGRDNSTVFMIGDGSPSFMDIAYISIGWGDNLPIIPS
jgi:hypothetical protein